MMFLFEIFSSTKPSEIKIAKIKAKIKPDNKEYVKRNRFSKPFDSQ